MTREGKLQEKLAHVRGELKRARARIKELEDDSVVSRGAYDGLLGIMIEENKKLRAEMAGMIGPPKPIGYEHFDWPMIRAIAATCSTQASRAGQSQDEVFTEKGMP